MPITIDLEKDPFYLEAKKEDAINLYKELNLSIEKIAKVLRISPEKVEKWIKEEGLLQNKGQKSE